MPNHDDELDQAERALEAEQARLRALKTRTDKLDREVDPEPAPLDHAEDGGVI